MQVILGFNCGGMESNEPKENKIDENVVSFLRKCSDHDAPRYAARMRNYLEVNRK